MKAVDIIVVLSTVYFLLINLNENVSAIEITNRLKKYATDNKISQKDTTTLNKNENTKAIDKVLNAHRRENPRLELSDQLAAAKEKCFDLLSITHGVKPHIGPLPWMTAILHSLKKRGDMPHYLCGGALISTNFVLTSAHCFTLRKFKPEDLIVRVGMHETSSMKYFQRSAIELLPHPQCDIGLIRLRKPIRYSDVINPICLPYLTTPTEWDTLTKEKSVLFAGWESLTPPPNVTYIDHLQDSVAYIMDDSECQKTYPKSNVSTTFCVYNVKNDSQLCTIDSGSLVIPLIPMPGNDIYIFPVLLGVLSIGQCPGASLMTNVEAFREWINKSTS